MFSNSTSNWSDESMKPISNNGTSGGEWKGTAYLRRDEGVNEIYRRLREPEVEGATPLGLPNFRHQSSQLGVHLPQPGFRLRV